MNEQVTCDRCCAVYEMESYTHLRMRDKDRHDCDICTAIVISRDGSSMPNLRLVHRPWAK